MPLSQRVKQPSNGQRQARCRHMKAPSCGQRGGGSSSGTENQSRLGVDPDAGILFPAAAASNGRIQSALIHTQGGAVN